MEVFIISLETVKYEYFYSESIKSNVLLTWHMKMKINRFGVENLRIGYVIYKSHIQLCDLVAPLVLVSEQSFCFLILKLPFKNKIDN